MALSRLFETAALADAAAFRGLRVLELGAGCGLPGLLLGKLGASKVVLTDMAQCVELLQDNIDDNELQACACAAALDWTSAGDLEAVTRAHGCEFDLVLAADTVYAPELVRPFHSLLLHFCTAPGTRVYFSAPRPRVQQATDAFFDLVRGPDSYFDVVKVPSSSYIAAAPASATATVDGNQGIFILTRKPVSKQLST